MTMVAGGASGDYSTSIGDGSASSSDSDSGDSREKKGRWKDSSSAGKLRSAGSSLSSAGSSESDRSSEMTASIKPVAYRTGGRVKKTGPAVVHRGERVIPASKRKKAEKVLRKAGMSLTNKKRGKKRGGRQSSGR